MRKFLIAFAFLIAGCTLPSQAPPPAAPAAEPRSSAPFEAWTVTQSRLEVRVFRAGTMEKLGHNHLITSDALTGTVELREPRTASGFRFELPIESLRVDDPEARKAAGPEFGREVPEKDREATRANMLGESVLDAKRQAVLILTADGLSGGPEQFELKLRVALRGEERVVAVPVSVRFEASKLEVRAHFSLRHADLGLTPFTAALGALRVRDDIGID